MFLQTIFYSTLSFLQDIAAFLQVMGVFLPPIFCSTSSFLQDIAVFLQVMGVFLPPIFYSTLSFLQDIAAFLQVIGRSSCPLFTTLGRTSTTLLRFSASWKQSRPCLRPFGFEWDPAVQHDPADRPLGHPCVA